MLTTLPDEFRNLAVIRDDLFRARVTTKVWQDILLSELDRPLIRGQIRQLVGKRIGPGVYEVRLELLEPKPDGKSLVCPNCQNKGCLAYYNDSIWVCSICEHLGAL